MSLKPFFRLWSLQGRKAGHLATWTPNPMLPSTSAPGRSNPFPATCNPNDKSAKNLLLCFDRTFERFQFGCLVFVVRCAH